mgnify:CR=1 FL=1
MKMIKVVKTENKPTLVVEKVSEAPEDCNQLKIQYLERESIRLK